MGRTRRRFIRKKRLKVVEEDDDEPEEEPSPYTSVVMRLASLNSISFVEWSSFENFGRLWNLELGDITEMGIEAEEEVQDVDFDFEDIFEGDDDEFEKQTKDEGKGQYILTSFGQRGEAELLRLIFLAVGEPFEDNQLLEDQVEGTLQATPYTSLPLITKGNHTWGEADAITRTLARKFCLLGKTNHEHFIVGATFERLCRLKRTHAGVVRLLPLEVKKKETMEWVDHQLRYVILPTAMAEWDKLILATTGPYIVASGLSLADIAIVDFLDQCTAKIMLDDLLADFDALSDLLMLVKQHPRISIYLDERPDFDWNDS